MLKVLIVLEYLISYYLIYYSLYITFSGIKNKFNKSNNNVQEDATIKK